MAEHEMYDYLPVAVPDYDAFLDVSPDKGLKETGIKSQTIRIAEDGISEERISFSDGISFTITMEWGRLRPLESGTIVDMYCDPLKANGMLKTFKYTHVDGHTYVVRFDSEVPRSIFSGREHAISTITLKVLGRIND